MNDRYPISLEDEYIHYENPGRHLYNTIKLCVAYDLLSFNNRIIPYAELSALDQSKFKKQVRRLFEACLLDASYIEYIMERYTTILKHQFSSADRTPQLVFG